MPDVPNIAREAFRKIDRIRIDRYVDEKIAGFGVDLEAGKVLHSPEREIGLEGLDLHIVAKRLPGGPRSPIKWVFINEHWYNRSVSS